MTGRKHKTKLDTVEVSAGGFNSQLSATEDLVPEKSLLAILFDRMSDVPPLVGSQFIAEVLVGRGEPEYHCLVCDQCGMSIQQVLPHLISVSHRLACLAKLEPEMHR